MSLRRPRIKPVAILKPRRPTIQDQNVPDQDISSATIIANQDYSIVDNSMESESIEIIPKSEFIAKSENEMPTERLLVENSKPTPPRRLIKPTVVIPGARKKSRQSIDATQTNAINQDDDCSIVDQKPDIKPLLTPTPVVDESYSIASPLSATAYDKPTDDYFKSPFMSPSMHNNNNQLTPGSSIVDDIVAPSSPIKTIRQRIRPTPYFNRRNSIQGTTSDLDDDTSNRQRQRHLSTSSSHSAHHNQNFNNKNSSQIGRIRTESTCSNVSDINSTTRSASGLKSKKVSSTRAGGGDGLTKISTVRRDFTLRFNGQTPDKTRLTMFDMIYYNPITNPMKNPAPKSNEVRDRRASVCSVASVKSVDSGKSLAAKSSIGSVPEMITLKQEPKEETPMPVPQLKLGPDGEIILDEQSLVIETTTGKEARETLANADIVYDDEFNGTSGFYKRTKRTRDWPADETIKFYRCLHTIGTDFSLMLTLFPKRTRRDLKLKFKREEKYNLSLINKALLHPKQFNIDDLKIELEHEEEEEIRKKTEWQELKEKQAKVKKEVIKEHKTKASGNRISRSLRDSNGYDIYEHEFVKVPKRVTRKKANKQRCEVDPDFVGTLEIGHKQKMETPLEITTTRENVDDCANYENDDIDPDFIDNVNVPEAQQMDVTQEIPTANVNYESDNENVFSPPGPKCSKKKQPQKSKTIVKSENNSEIQVKMIECEYQQDDVQQSTHMEIQEITEYEFHRNDIQQPTDMELQETNEYELQQTTDDNNIYEETGNLVIADIRDANLIPENENEYILNDPTVKEFIEKQDSGSPLKMNTNDILNMDIIFEQNDELDAQYESSTMKTECQDVQLLEPMPDNSLTFNSNYEHKNENDNCDVNNDSDNNSKSDDSNNDDESDDDDDDSDSDDIDKLKDLQGSLVVVASTDQNDPTKIVHEVFVMSSVTGQLSEEPLDLPQDVIEQIMLTMNPA